VAFIFPRWFLQLVLMRYPGHPMAGCRHRKHPCQDRFDSKLDLVGRNG